MNIRGNWMWTWPYKPANLSTCSWRLRANAAECCKALQLLSERSSCITSINQRAIQGYIARSTYKRAAQKLLQMLCSLRHCRGLTQQLSLRHIGSLSDSSQKMARVQPGTGTSAVAIAFGSNMVCVSSHIVSMTASLSLENAPDTSLRAIVG